MIPASDRAFLHGRGLFETLRAYSGVPFRLADHVVGGGQHAREVTHPRRIVANPREWNDVSHGGAVIVSRSAGRCADSKLLDAGRVRAFMAVLGWFSQSR